MRIRWIGTTVAGTFHNRPQGPKTGEAIDWLDDDHARRYIRHELAIPADDQDSAHF